MNEIKKTTLHPDNQPNTDLYPKTSTDQVEGLNNIITGINNEIEKKVNTVDNFVRVFTIPNGVSSGTLTANVKEKLCNPDGHNYYVYDDTSEMILKYSFNSENEIIQYKAMYLQTNKAYEITMQILPSNGSWRRSQTVLNVPASAGGKLYKHYTSLVAFVEQATLNLYVYSISSISESYNDISVIPLYFISGIHKDPSQYFVVSRIIRNGSKLKVYYLTYSGNELEIEQSYNILTDNSTEL